MINKKSLSTLQSNVEKNNKFIKPDYSNYCFSNIPGTIESLLTEKTNLKKLPNDVLPGSKTKYKKVIFMFIDAFGWSFWEENKEKLPALKRFFKNGSISKITSQFPSTTSAHVTTIHTGKSLAETGVYEWFYYEPKVDDIIMPLLNSFARNTKSLSKEGYKSKDLYPENTFYSNLIKKDINVFTYQSEKIVRSEYNKYILKDSNNFGYHTATEGLIKLKKDIEKNDGLFFYYYSNIDSICHKYGPESEELNAEINVFFNTLENIFLTKTENIKDTILLLSADHGQTFVDISKPYYINIEIPEITNYIQKNKKGELIVPSGSCRDFFLHIKPENLETVYKMLKEKLSKIADVRKTSDMIEQGYFGNKISENFKNKVGNLVILAYEDNSVWWYEKDVFEVFLTGMHGGLTKEEMEIPFIGYEL